MAPGLQQVWLACFWPDGPTPAKIRTAANIFAASIGHRHWPTPPQSLRDILASSQEADLALRTRFLIGAGPHQCDRSATSGPSVEQPTCTALDKQIRAQQPNDCARPPSLRMTTTAKKPFRKIQEMSFQALVFSAVGLMHALQQQSLWLAAVFVFSKVCVPPHWQQLFRNSSEEVCSCDGLFKLLLLCHLLKVGRIRTICKSGASPRKLRASALDCRCAGFFKSTNFDTANWFPRVCGREACGQKFGSVRPQRGDVSSNQEAPKSVSSACGARVLSRTVRALWHPLWGAKPRVV